MSPELAARILPIFIGTVAALITAGSLITADYKMAAVGAVLLVLAVVANVAVRIQSRNEPQDPPDHCV